MAHQGAPAQHLAARAEAPRGVSEHADGAREAVPGHQVQGGQAPALGFLTPLALCFLDR